MLHRALPLLLTLLLAGCAVSGLLPDWSSEDAAGPEPTGYRFLIANKLTTITGDPSKFSSIEISAPKRVESLKGASWKICLKTQMFPLLPRYYAVFMQRGEIVDNRVSVMIDQCELQSFAAFDWASDAKNP